SSVEQKSYAVRLAHSGDGGLTFDSRVDAQDSSAAKFFMLPSIVREDAGAIDIAYYAGNKDLDAAGSLRVARSTDAGKTFSSSVPLASPITFSTNRGDALWLGDYFGLVVSNGKLYSAYA